MPYIGNQPAESFTSFATQEFSTSATTSYTLDHAVTNENEIALFINNVRQQPGSGKAYTATGTALTLSAATASTDTMYCVFLGRALQTVNPAGGSIGSSQLSADAITGQTALTSAPDDTDEFLVSDAGTIKRIDYSLIKGVGKIVQVAQSVSTTAVTPSSATIITSLDFTPTSSSNKVLLFANCAQIRKADAGTGSAASIRIFVGSTATNAQSSNEGYPESESDTRGNITTIGHHDCWSGQQTVSVKSDGFGSNISYSYQDSPTTLIVMEVEQKWQ